MANKKNTFDIGNFKYSTYSTGYAYIGLVNCLSAIITAYHVSKHDTEKLL